MDNIITINGHKYSFEQGETILEVAKRNGIFIPTLCYLKGATPTGACRICIVEAKKVPGFISSCSTPAASNLEVFTDTKRIHDARRTILELMLISGNHNCSVRDVLPQEWTDFQAMVEEYDRAGDICTAYGRCQLQDLAYKYMVTERTFDSLPVEYPLDFEDPLIARDFSRCILCGKCVYACNEIQVNRAISHGYRGMQSKIVVRGDTTIPESDCVYCGECIQVCPVGSLFEKKGRFNSRIWEVDTVRTTCHYCGVGCQLELYVHKEEGKIVKVRGIEEAEPNHDGRLCFRGRFAFDFLYSEKRLTKPQIRKNGALQEVEWDEALDLIAAKLKEIKEKYGPDQVASTVSTKYTTEDLFSVKKFFQAVLGAADNVVHFENSTFPGIVYEDLDKASTIVIAGADITRETPVAGSYVKQAVLHGVKLVVIDPRDTDISKFAKIHQKDFTGIDRLVDGDNIIVFHHPEFDITPLKKMRNTRIFSLTRENNAIGAYLMGIKSGEDFDLAGKKFVYSLGRHFKKRDKVEFLVVQDLFDTEYSADADVVLPSAVWAECEGTYISSDLRVNRVRKAVDPPGEAKPTTWIFKELAKRMGQNWESTGSREIWEKEITLVDPHLKEIDYSKLEGDGIKIDKGHPLSFSGADKLPPGIDRIDSHKVLCAHCKDMENVFKKLF
ncbi:MAG: molybdopterin-dependent oxidoreductase [Candidatus Aminicenantes bacterium]|nr:molybdopterin-dependent oxidoreductase [Candidatus Aminicenantes bacterium]